MSFHNQSNLNRHIKRAHSAASRDSTMDEDDGDSAQSEDSRPEDVSETSSNASDTDDSDADSTIDDDGDDGDDDTVFDDILRRVKARHDDPDSLSHEQLQKLFRAKYRNVVLWIHKLRKHPTHQLVMQTAKDYRDGPYEYDYEESIQVAIDKRKHKLNRLVPKEEEEEDDDIRYSMNSMDTFVTNTIQ